VRDINSGDIATAPDWLSLLTGGEPNEALRSLFDAIPGGLVICDAASRVVFSNRAAAAFPDLIRLIDPKTERVVPPERMPAARALRGESVDGEEYLLRRPGAASGTWIECGGNPVRGPGGKIAGAVLTIRDIGPRKKKELALEAAAELRDFIFQENLAGIIRTTVDGRIIDCNPAILRMLGYESKQQLLAVRAPHLYFDPAERDRLLSLIAAPRHLREFEVCLRRADGTRCWALLRVRLLDPPPGQVGGTIVSTVIDITERKIWEESLRQSEQRFSAFMRHLPGIAFIKDLTGRYVFHNEASWTQFRVRPEDIVGRTDEQLWSAEDAARSRRNDNAVIESGRPLEFVETVVQADGTHSWLVYKFPIMEHGKVVLTGGVGIDITERTVLEEQLTQVRKMEALGRLAGGVAHDFNNLLTVISGYGQLALEGVGNAAPERMITYLKEILNSSLRASGLTGQLLAFSRRQVVQPAVLDLGALLRNMERLLQRVIGEHVELTVRSSAEACLIRADAHQMEQVIMNLAVNARDAMPLGGTLEIRCERLAEPAATDGEPLAVLLEVRDTGVGMDDATRAKIFDPFFTSKATGKGTGLGLSTVYGIVSQAKGTIACESEEGAGTVFRILFPAAAEGETPAPAPQEAVPKGLETVLLVEDEASVRTLAKTILSRLGYHVLAAESGPAAIAIWEERQGAVDVLLTDVIMPQMSGGDLALKLREKNARLKVLFMSGYTDDILESHGILAGETQLIQKPFTAETLARRLRDVLDA
jgi:PAS domain S-box-containing protein